jgi:LmbE family N-acetylglucosaminyl deacetylase
MRAMRIVHAPSRKSILAIAAHPDDIESWCAGTLAQAYDAGSITRLLLVTAGDQGSEDPRDTRATVAVRREAEARAAARLLGIAEVECLHYPDGEVEDTRALRADLVRWIRNRQPDIVFTHDSEQPLPAYLAHRDHREVGRAALDAVYPLARDRLAFADVPAIFQLAPHAVKQVWLFASAQADTVVDIVRGFDRKVQARLAHVSQTPNPANLAVHWRERAAEIGQTGPVPLGEAFTVLHLDC